MASSALPDTTFSLSSKSLKLTTAEDIEPHLEPLKSSSSITHVILTGNTLGVPASKALAPLLSKQKSLVSANLADIFTARLLDEIPPALDALLTALLQCPKLETVDLSDNAFGLNTVEPLVKFLRQHVPLRHLILNNNGLGPKAGALVGEALVELANRKDAARKNGDEVPELETIVCGRNRLESGSMAAWAKAYQVLRGIKSVKMVQNGIRPEGIVLLLRQGLGDCSKLETLDLQDNTFTAEGATALADVVGRWEHLTELGVSDCLLKARGALYVARALAQGRNTGLRTLRMQYAEMDGRGLKILVGSVNTDALPKLQRIELNGNKFAEDDANVLHLKQMLDRRREQTGADEDDEAWGIDELDDMEEDEEDEDEEEVEEETEPGRADAEEKIEQKEDRAKAAERVLQEADQAEGETVAQKKDKEVDDLADALSKTL